MNKREGPFIGRRVIDEPPVEFQAKDNALCVFRIELASYLHKTPQYINMLDSTGNGPTIRRRRMGATGISYRYFYTLGDIKKWMVSRWRGGGRYPHPTGGHESLTPCLPHRLIMLNETPEVLGEPWTAKSVRKILPMISSNGGWLSEDELPCYVIGRNIYLEGVTNSGVTKMREALNGFVVSPTQKTEEQLVAVDKSLSTGINNERTYRARRIKDLSR